MAVDVVIFDLGGVLAEFRGGTEMARLTGITDPAEFWRRWLTSPYVRRFERGQCTPEEFGVGMVAEWGLDLSGSDYLDAFDSWLDDPFPGADELVAAVGERARIACLSNMNPVHWERKASHWPMMARFEHVFLSQQMGMVKPDPEIFAHVLSELGTDPAATVFLDDNELNVQAARESGIVAVVTAGVDAAAAALRELGVLDG
jgi:putative hydrolase of the HAD superfamily